MTPTPEEVKDRVAVKHGYHGWKQFLKYCTGNLNEDYIIDLENEAMRDYAEALYKERLEAASGELPTDKEVKEKFGYIADIESIYCKLQLESADYIRKEASSIISWEREKFQALSNLSKKQLEQKDKEIEELKKGECTFHQAIKLHNAAQEGLEELRKLREEIINLLKQQTITTNTKTK